MRGSGDSGCREDGQGCQQVKAPTYPLLCVNVYLCKEYEEFLRAAGDDEQLKQKLAGMIRIVFEEYGVTVPAGEFAVAVTGRRSGIA